STSACPTQTTSPVPDATGQHGANSALVASTVYDYWTGHVTAATDANNKTTTAEYDDVLDRLTKITRPDGGWTSYWYDRNSYGDYVGSHTAIDATRSTESYAYTDGLGRSVRSFQYDQQVPT